MVIPDAEVPYPCGFVGESTWGGVNPGGTALLARGDPGMIDGEGSFACAWGGEGGGVNPGGTALLARGDSGTLDDEAGSGDPAS